MRPEAIKLMQEIGINIRGHRSKHMDESNGQRLDYVITVCDNGKDSCPVFLAAVKRLHDSFDDPPPPSFGTDENAWRSFGELEMSCATTSVCVI